MAHELLFGASPRVGGAEPDTGGSPGRRAVEPASRPDGRLLEAAVGALACADGRYYVRFDAPIGAQSFYPLQAGDRIRVSWTGGGELSGVIEKDGKGLFLRANDGYVMQLDGLAGRPIEVVE